MYLDRLEDTMTDNYKKVNLLFGILWHANLTTYRQLISPIYILKPTIFFKYYPPLSYGSLLLEGPTIFIYYF